MWLKRVCEGLPVLTMKGSSFKYPVAAEHGPRLTAPGSI